ncbi:hypothetical protein QT970_31620 [Microcoleus sp. herbarium8]|uniref:hypothetical protein n=1 Tax=Microcoleus sp. herbarium8 TaxID=3055436 RepID=UPI002FD1A4E2
MISSSDRTKPVSADISGNSTQIFAATGINISLQIVRSLLHPRNPVHIKSGTIGII